MSNRRRHRPAPSMRAQAIERAQAQERARRRRRVVFGVIVGLAVLAGVTGLAILLTRGSTSEAAEPDPLAADLGCASCHSVDGSRSEGPTWKGLWGSEVELADGTTVTADEAYLRRAITDPAAEVVAGFSAMPEVQVTDEQVDQLVAIIRDEG